MKGLQKKLLVLLLVFTMLFSVACGNQNQKKDDSNQEQEKQEPKDNEQDKTESEEKGNEEETNQQEPSGSVSLDDVNRFLNESAKLGEGSKANPVAVIPFHHVDGPKDEDLFYGFVNFKFVSRNFIKYQVSYISCTCRPAAYNYWQTAYVELTLPESKKLEDVEIKTLSFDKDSEGKYLGGFWGDSDPIPNGTTYEQIKTEFLPYFIGKTWGELKDLRFIDDIDLAEYQKGDGRSNYTIDTFSGASVSTNNIIRLIEAIVEYHGTDSHFSGEGSSEQSPADNQEQNQDAQEQKPADDVKDNESSTQAPVVSGTKDVVSLPDPRDTGKKYTPKDGNEELACEVDNYSIACSSITAENLDQYMGRDDVLYIDLRDYKDYIKKHLRNFEVIPFFGLIWDKEAHTDPEAVQLYGGDLKDPVANYEESDELLEVLFPKDKTIFFICQSGGRVAMLMDILEAKGWDMSKIYNIGGMAQYTDGKYRDMIVDTIEMGVEDNYSWEGLTKKSE